MSPRYIDLFRQQLGEVSEVLDQADPALADAFSRLDCSELFFAYRMLLVLMSRELRLSEVSICTGNVAYHESILRISNLKEGTKSTRPA